MYKPLQINKGIRFIEILLNFLLRLKTLSIRQTLVEEYEQFLTLFPYFEIKNRLK